MGKIVVAHGGTTDGERVPINYLALLIALWAVAYILLLIFNSITDVISYSSEPGIAAGQAMLTVLIGSSFLVFAIVPYFQTLIVLSLRRLITKNA